MIENHLQSNISRLFYISAMMEDDSGGIYCCQCRNGKAEVLGFTPLKRNTFSGSSALCLKREYPDLCVVKFQSGITGRSAPCDSV